MEYFPISRWIHILFLFQNIKKKRLDELKCLIYIQTSHSKSIYVEGSLVKNVFQNVFHLSELIRDWNIDENMYWYVRRLIFENYSYEISIRM